MTGSKNMKCEGVCQDTFASEPNSRGDKRQKVENRIAAVLEFLTNTQKHAHPAVCGAADVSILLFLSVHTSSRPNCKVGHYIGHAEKNVGLKRE